MDTVPPGDGWTRPPLKLTVEGRMLYGRGTADMKGAIAAKLAAFRAAEAAGLPLAFDPVLLFCTDEEGGLYPGICYLAEQGLMEGHLMSFNGGAVPRIWAGCFGSLDLAIEVEGRAAHSGDAKDGVNAIETAIPLLNALMELKRKVERRTSNLPPPPHNNGRPLHARLSVTAAQGGQKGSSLPGRFRLVLNRRYAPRGALRGMQPTIDGIFSLLYTSNAVWNETKWNNKEFDRLVAEARQTADEAKRHELYGEAQKLMHDQVPTVIPVFFDLLAAQRDYVQGFQLHPRGAVFRIDHVSLTEKAPRRG